MKRFKLIFVCMLALFCVDSYAQKQEFKKANKAYKSKNYAQAIPFFEQGLALKDNLANKTKLANCYRMTNQMDQAENLYKEIVRDPKARPITYFYFGETLMSNEKYNEAKYWFQQYNYKVPDDEKGPLMIAACANIKDIRPTFPNAETLEFSQNSDGDDTAPVFYNDGIVFSSDRKQGVKLLKQKSGWTGRDYITLYFSKEEEGFRYSKPKSFSGKINELNKNTANISFSQDRSLAVFTRNSATANRKNVFTMQLYQAESNGNGKWKNIKEVPFCNVAYNYMHPALSPDGQSLYFVSDKGGGQGGTDIYVAKRKKNGNWARPVNLGPVINTSSNEGFPYIYTDGRLYFCSKGHVGYGGFDVFHSDPETETEGWTAPVNVGKPVNSPYDDISIYLSEDGERGMFTSSRKSGDDDIYLFWKNGLPEGIQTEVEEEVVTEAPISSEVTTPTPEISTPSTTIPEETTIVKKDNNIPSVSELKTASEKTITKTETPTTPSIDNNRANAITETPKPAVETPQIETVVENKVTTPNTAVTKESLKPTVSELAKASNKPLGKIEPITPPSSNYSSEQEYTAPQKAATTVEQPVVNNQLKINPSNVTSSGGMNPTTPKNEIISNTVDATAPISNVPVEVPTEYSTIPETPTSTEVQPVIKTETTPVVTETIPPSTTIISEPEVTTPVIEETITQPVVEETIMDIPTTNEELPKVIEETAPKVNNIDNRQSAIPTKEIEQATASIENNIAVEETPKGTTQPRTRIISTESLLVRKKYGEQIVNDALPTSPRADNPQNLRRARRSASSNAKFSELSKDLKRSRPMSGKYYRLENIKYEIGSHAVTADVAPALDKLVDLLNTYPTMNIELGSHTYSIGNDDRNLVLSRQRVESIREYLSLKGIDLNRIQPVGYGEQFILNHCSNGVVCTQEQHALNERIEVKVLDRK